MQLIQSTDSNSVPCEKPYCWWEFFRVWIFFERILSKKKNEPKCVYIIIKFGKNTKFCLCETTFCLYVLNLGWCSSSHVSHPFSIKYLSSVSCMQKVLHWKVILFLDRHFEQTIYQSCFLCHSPHTYNSHPLHYLVLFYVLAEQAKLTWKANPKISQYVHFVLPFDWFSHTQKLYYLILLFSLFHLAWRVFSC